MSIAVGDEGGFAPNVPNHEAAIQMILDAISAAGYTAGEQIDRHRPEKLFISGEYGLRILRRTEWKGFSFRKSECQSDLWMRREFFCVITSFKNELK
jgi:hypothetical protein